MSSGSICTRNSAHLYEGPFTDVAPQGPEKVFDEGRVTRLFATINEINASAAA